MCENYMKAASQEREIKHCFFPEILGVVLKEDYAKADIMNLSSDCWHSWHFLIQYALHH